MKKKIFCLLLAVLFTLAACSKSPQTTFEPLPGIDVPAGNFNIYFKLVDDPNSANSHKNGDLLLIRIMNLSSESIVLPDNYGIKLFAKENGAWVEFPNIAYNAGGQFYLPTKDSYPLGLMASIGPSQSGLSSPVTIRIVVTGHIENDTSKKVGAYLDVVITP